MPTEYHARHLERFPLGTAYPEIVRRVAALLKDAKLASGPAYEEWKTAYMGGGGGVIRHPRSTAPALILDATGAGRPVFDMFKAEETNPVGVSIHGGDAVSHDVMWKVPKRDLVGAMRVSWRRNDSRSPTRSRSRPC